MEQGKIISLHIKASQTDSEGSTNKVEFYTEGKCYEKGESLYITYKETEVTGMEGTTSTLVISKDSVSLLRFGTVASKFVFKKGVETRSAYKTGYGDFDMVINTKELEIAIDNQKKSSLYLKYDLDINRQEHMVNELCVSF